MVQAPRAIWHFLLIIHLSRGRISSMDGVRYVDELVREYLLFRGYTRTFSAFSGERSGDKAAFRVPDVCAFQSACCASLDVTADCSPHLTGRRHRGGNVGLCLGLRSCRLAVDLATAGVPIH